MRRLQAGEAQRPAGDRLALLPAFLFGIAQLPEDLGVSVPSTVGQSEPAPQCESRHLVLLGDERPRKHRDHRDERAVEQDLVAPWVPLSTLAQQVAGIQSRQRRDHRDHDRVHRPTAALAVTPPSTPAASRSAA